MGDATYDLTSTLPRVRVGWLISTARRNAGMSDREVADTVGVTPRTVRRWESGGTAPSDQELVRLAAVLDTTVAALAPTRDVVTVTDDGRLRVGTSLVSFSAGDGSREGNDVVLRRYTEAVRFERHLGPNDPVRLRREDLAVLAVVLDLDDQDLERHLHEIVGVSLERAAVVRGQLLRRRLVLPVAGLALGTLGVVSAVRLASDGRADPANAVTTPPASTATPATTPPLAVTTTIASPAPAPVAPATTAAVPVTASAVAAPASPVEPAPTTDSTPAPAATATTAPRSARTTTTVVSTATSRPPLTDRGGVVEIVDPTTSAPTDDQTPGPVPTAPSTTTTVAEPDPMPTLLPPETTEPVTTTAAP